MLEAQEKALAEWAAAKAKKGQLSNEGAKWEEKLKEAYDKGRAALETLSLEVCRAAAGTNRAPRPCQHPAAPLHLRRPLSSPRPPPVPLAQVAASVTSGGELWQKASSTKLAKTVTSDKTGGEVTAEAKTAALDLNKVRISRDLP